MKSAESREKGIPKFLPKEGRLRGFCYVQGEGGQKSKKFSDVIYG